jgi:invasion protein IalB
MKKLIALILLIATPAFAWEFDTYENEMGDIHYKEVYVVEDIAFSVILWEGRLMIVVKPDERFVSGQKLDIKIDNHDIIRLAAFEKQGAVFAPAVPPEVWDQMLAGIEMKVRYFTQSNSRTVSISLEGITQPLTKLLEIKNGLE